MSLTQEEKTNLQLVKFNENLQRVILKTKVIVNELIKSHPKLATSYGEIPKTLDLALDVVQGTFVLPGFDRIYGTMFAFLNKYIEALGKGIDLFGMINDKNDKVLTEHLSALFTNNPYVDKLQYIYGANSERKKYVDESDVATMWKFIIATMHRAIKWAILSGDSRFSNVINKDMVKRFKINMDN